MSIKRHVYTPPKGRMTGVFAIIGGMLATVFVFVAIPLSQKLNGMLAPLHFGFYGSTLVKWLYFVGGFAPALLALSGTAIWYLRTRKHTRPVRGPRLQTAR